MEITLLGAITIILSIYAFFKDKKLLLYIMVFLSTFTAANLIHITVTTTPVLTFEFTGAMWLLRELIDFVKSKPKITKEIIINKFKENKLATAFLIFIATIILGEVYLAVSGISIEYTNILKENAVLTFSKANITMGVRTIFIFLIMIVLSFKIKTKKEVEELVKVFCISSIFAVIWGLLQFITFYLGIPYPAFLFNNNMYAAQCYDQIENNIKRITSIALEPSTFAINLMAFLPFVIGTYLKMKSNFKDKKYLWIFIITIVTTACAILTTSSTTYVGLVAVYGLFVLYILFGFRKKGEFDNRKKNFNKIALLTVASIVFVLLLGFGSLKTGYALKTIDYIKTEQKAGTGKKQDGKQYSSAIENMLKTFKQMTIQKLGSGSGQERMEGERIGLSMFKYSPVLGLGFTSYRTFSMFTNILINAGILGILAYLYILYIVIKELIRYRKKDEVASVMFLISIIGTTIAFFVGVPDLLYTFYWIIIVLGYKYATLEN